MLYSYYLSFKCALPISEDFCDPPQCMPDEYKMADAVDGYKKYYEIGKAHLKDK